MFCWRKHILLIIVAFVAATGCEQRARISALYNIDSLVNEQIVMLAADSARLVKEAMMGEEADDTLYLPKGYDAWSNELDVFRQLDAINKPVNRSTYLVDDNLYDPGSNLTVKAFTSLEPLPVRSLRVYYMDDIAEPRKIEALYTEENVLYKSSRLLSMNFQQINNKTLLTSYSVVGGQKMVLRDTVTFSIRGKVRFR